MLGNLSDEGLNVICRSDMMRCIRLFLRVWEGFVMEVWINSEGDGVNLYDRGREHKVREGVF